MRALPIPVQYRADAEVSVCVCAFLGKIRFQKKVGGVHNYAMFIYAYQFGNYKIFALINELRPQQLVNLVNSTGNNANMKMRNIHSHINIGLVIKAIKT